MTDDSVMFAMGSESLGSFFYDDNHEVNFTLKPIAAVEDMMPVLDDSGM